MRQHPTTRQRSSTIDTTSVVLLRRAVTTGDAIQTAPPIVQQVLRGAAQPLDRSSRTLLEWRFGHDFSGVRVHTDAQAAESARAVGARAYTVGRDVVFGAGQYQPQTADGQRLLAHELTHTIQQRNAMRSPGEDLAVGASNSAAESSADRAASDVMRGSSPSDVGSADSVIQRDDGPSSDVGTVYLRLREDGRVEFMYGTPNLPAAGELGFGFRCENGRCRPVGSRGPGDLGDTYTLDEALGLLRGIGGRGSAGAGSTPGLGPGFPRIPSTPGRLPGLPGPLPGPLPGLPGRQATPGVGGGFRLPSADQLRLRPSPQVARLVGSLTIEGFATNSATLTGDHQAQITTHAGTLRSLLESYPGGTIEIVGHTDAVGSEASNQTLGQQRADAVRDALIAAGIDAAIISATSAGEQSLRVPTQQAEPRNRAAVISFRPEPRVRLLNSPGLRLQP